MVTSVLPKRFFNFLFIIVITIVTAHFSPKILATGWYIALMVLYARSKDEPFWAAFFLTTGDGFMGFLGIYTVALQLVPGIPAVELSQFYVVLSILKAKNNIINRPFYNGYLNVLLLYTVLTIIFGMIWGLSGDINSYFRVIKFILPLGFFYSIPRLFTKLEDYERFFSFIFIVLILGFATQILTLLTGISPVGRLRITDEQLAEAGQFRKLYNGRAVLIGTLGSLFFLTIKGKRSFSTFFLYIVLVAAFGLAFLSASRGWILAIGMTIALTLMVIRSLTIKRIIGFGILISVILVLAFSNEKIEKQINFAYDRFLTLEDLAEGDITAGGTLIRLNIRGPRVMKKWAESPIVGFGYSDIYRKYGDGHVGNQNLLLHSGIIGFALLIGFFIYFSIYILSIWKKTPTSFPYKKSLLVFVIFLAAWFLLHSTSSQHFAYGGLPFQIIPQAVFFSFGALMVNKAKEWRYGEAL